MFGTLVYTELDKLAGCGAGKKAQKSPLMKTDAVSMVKKALMENPQQITPPGGYQQPKPITPPVGGIVPPAQPVTPAEGEKPQPLSSINQPRYKQASLQESTMNMFGVLVNMELQKLAQDGGFTAEEQAKITADAEAENQKYTKGTNRSVPAFGSESAKIKNLKRRGAAKGFNELY